ncbi:hypothetical protein MHIB_12760 [Mycolicibacter hiberniae]|uniref:Uncharacterized protein n=1 Tax=Mycolicibacter hiberniae TaxID=29314 RepID=A0A7I7X3K4_9MYCO|nr:hypothetical protein MHIB_12760 [Mycolicibacter hiberniae]
MTPAPRPGYMFSIAPIQTPMMPVRRSPKYFHVRESEVNGSTAGAGLGAAGAVLGVLLSAAACAGRSMDAVGVTVITSPV